MAAGREGEHTRFPFLDTVRALVATMVTVLAVAVVVMVIAVVHRPVEMGFQSYGYVQTQDWWWSQSSATSSEDRPADKVDLLLLVYAVNPSGRGEINGSIDTIHIIDVPDASFAGMVDFCLYKLETPVQFQLPPHSSHRLRTWVRISAPYILQYLYDKHNETSGFSAMLKVETTYKPAQSDIKKVNFFCWPVTVRKFDDLLAGGEVTCKTTEEMTEEIGFNVSRDGFPPRLSPPPTTKW